MKNFHLTLLLVIIMSFEFLSCNNSGTNSNQITKKDTAEKQISDSSDEPEEPVAIGNSVIYILHNGRGNEFEEGSNPIAVPIVLYHNGKYEAPAYCEYGATEKESIRNCEKAKKTLSPFVKAGKILFLLDKGKKSAELVVKKEIAYGLSDWSRPSGLLQKSEYRGKLLTNNSNIGTNKLVYTDDYPKLPKRKSQGFDENGNPIPGPDYSDILVDSVDINGDGRPELVYECEDYEGVYYVIFSKINGIWKKVYEGSYDGV